MKQEFIPDLDSKKRSPLAPPIHEEFDWKSLYSSLGELSEPDSTERERMAVALNAVLTWVLNIDFDKSHRPQQLIGRRVIALAWATNPALFGGISLSELSRRLGINQRETLSNLTSDFSATFGIRNAGQSNKPPNRVSVTKTPQMANKRQGGALKESFS